MVENIKNIHGRRWDPENKYWTIPNTEGSKFQLVNMFKGKEITWSLEVENRQIKNKCKDNYDLDGLIDDLKKQLILKGYTHKTIKAYVGHIRRFLQYANRPSEELRSQDVEEYMHLLLKGQENSHSYVN